MAVIQSNPLLGGSDGRLAYEATLLGREKAWFHCALKLVHARMFV